MSNIYLPVYEGISVIISTIKLSLLYSFIDTVHTSYASPWYLANIDARDLSDSCFHGWISMYK